MSIVAGTNTINIAITQAGGLGIAPATGILPAAVLSLPSSFQSGSLADQFALIHAKTYAFAASTPIILDLTALLDVLGNSISFAAVRFLAYRIQSTNAAYVLTFGGAGANEWNGLLTSGSKIVWQPSTAANAGFSIIQAPSLAGMPVTSASKLLKLDPGANAVGNVDLVIAGS
jgi:hypothetical protein